MGSFRTALDANTTPGGVIRFISPKLCHAAGQGFSPPVGMLDGRCGTRLLPMCTETSDHRALRGRSRDAGRAL